MIIVYNIYNINTGKKSKIGKSGEIFEKFNIF